MKESCKRCGRHIRSEDSILREHGMACYIVYLEERLTRLELALFVQQETIRRLMIRVRR